MPPERIAKRVQRERTRSFFGVSRCAAHDENQKTRGAGIPPQPLASLLSLGGLSVNLPSQWYAACSPRNMVHDIELARPARAPSWRELAGLGAGLLLAPLASLVGQLRRARVFHPVGCTFRAQIEAKSGLSADWAGLAARLSGPALARFSGALWRGNFEVCDVLGVALRLRSSKDTSVELAASDQDLLFATIVSPFTMPFAPFTTNARDYLANKYWAVSPFEIGRSRHAKFRLSPLKGYARSASSEPRDHALASAVERAHVPLQLEARYTFQLKWHPLATVWLTEPLDLDQEALRFSPFQTGRGIVPSGFVHSLRRATYAASQRARPRHRP